MGAPPQAFVGGSLIQQVTTDKAMYAPGTPVQITVDLKNTTSAAYTGDITLTFFHLAATVAPELSQRVESVNPGAEQTLTFTWNPPAADFTGYRVEARALSGQTTRDMAATAVDVSSDWSRFPRYGFISRFDAGLDTAAVIAKLKDYHINGLQFYDWQWEHHRPYSPEQEWPDIANRPISRETVAKFIDDAHQADMVAMNYNLAFGGFQNYWNDGSGAKPEWGLFKTKSNNGDPQFQDFHPLPETWATQKLFLFNPGNPDWQQFLFDQERQVFENFAFDGWHIDTLGKRGGVFNANGELVSLANSYADFTNNAKTALNKRMVFNTVGTYGQEQIAKDAEVDFIYSELWENDGAATYDDINHVVEQARKHSDKAVVLPAYMNKAYAQETPGGQTRHFNESGVRYANATIFAAGASHLELGDDEGMLSSEYFPAQPLVMSDSLKAAMHDSYDFLVAYQNLLRDGVTGASNTVTIENVETSERGMPRTVWAMTKAKPGYTIAHLINFTTLKLNHWRDNYANYPAPTPLTDLKVKLYVAEPPRAEAKLWYATPDADHGRAHSLTYTNGSDADGSYITFTLPRLEYWDMVWLEQ